MRAPPAGYVLSLPESPQTTWEDARRELRAEVTEFAFHMWFEPLEPAGHDGHTLFLRAPGHVRSWVGDRYGDLLEQVVRRTGGARRVELVDESWRPEPEHRTLNTEHPAREGARTLNPKYTFSQFVIGDGNRLAHAAALAVAEQPGQTYNPLFIHGPPGLGKTHLLHAIGNYVAAYGSGLRVTYATVEDFTADFVQAVRRGKAEGFRERFRDTDVLLLDDIQFLADKLKTKEEFFHTFNSLYETGGQLVLTSDRSPADLEAFEARLTERFECGLVADLQPPSLDVRLAILRKRAKLDALTGVGDETLEEIASQVQASVRVLEGALIRVVAYASLRGVQATPDLAREVLDRLYPQRQELACTLERIQEVTAEAFGLTRETLLARDRRPAVAQARQVAMYLARELTDEALPAIGRSFGGRNHTTVLHAHRKVAADARADEGTRRRIDAVRTKLTVPAPDRTR